MKFILIQKIIAEKMKKSTTSTCKCDGKCHVCHSCIGCGLFPE